VALLIGRILFAAISIVSGSTAHLLKWREGVSYAPRQQRSRARAARARVGRDRTRRRAARLLRPLGRSRRAPAGRLRLPVAVGMQAFWKLADPMQRANQQVHFMKNVSLGGAALALFALFQQFGSEL
jgi:putative oxidoreductase